MKLHATIALVVAAAVGALVFVFVQIGGTGSKGGVKVGARSAQACTEQAPECMPKIEMTDRRGKTWEPADLENKVVLINVWATWCAPCKQELPELVSLREHYGDDVVLLGVLTDEPGDATVDGFVRGYRINYPIIPLTGVIDEAFASPSRLPTTFVYDRSGHLAHQKTGAISSGRMRRVIDKLL